MSRSSLLRFASTALVLAALAGSALPASANHRGATAAACVVDGKVIIYDDSSKAGKDPINMTRETNYFYFSDTSLACDGVIMGTVVNHLDPFIVTAEGYTTGLVDSSGETCFEGKSQGQANMVANGPMTLYGKLQYRRVASSVYAWGALYKDAARTDLIGALDAGMWYTPQPPTDAVGCLAEDGGAIAGFEGVREAQLNGIGTVTDHVVPGARPIP